MNTDVTNVGRPELKIKIGKEYSDAEGQDQGIQLYGGSYSLDKNPVTQKFVPKIGTKHKKKSRR